MLHIRDDDRDAALHDGQEQLVLAREVAVERLIRRTCLGDNVTDSRRLWSGLFHQPHRRREYPLNLLGGTALAFVKGATDRRRDTIAHGRQGMPPSTRRVAPLVKLDASDAKNNAAPTISAGLPSRFRAKICARWRVASRSHALLMSVKN